MTFKDHRTIRTGGGGGGGVRSHRPASACAPWAMLLPDAAEGLLSEGEQRAFDGHLAVCSGCSEELAAAQRGLAWLTVLKDAAPEPPKHLLANILAQTTAMAETGVRLPELLPYVVPVGGAAGHATPGEWGWMQAGTTLRGWLRGDEGTWSSLLQPRLAITGAMAFFSICITLNLLGISVNQLDAQTFRKGGLHRTVTNIGATIVRSLQGLQVVYRVESRVNEMRAGMSDTEGVPSAK